ncbi:MAG: DUF4013 domain-containing protein [Acidobacteriota bacterium]
MATVRRESLEIERALRFFLDDPRWVPKILVGALFTALTVFLIGNFWVAGYMVRVVRRASRAERYPLPEWDDMAGIFRDGLRAMAVYVGHLFPLVVLLTLLGLALAGAISLLDNARGGATGAEVMLLLLVLAGYILFTLISLVLLLYLPAAFARFAVEDRVRAAFEPRETYWFIRRNLSNYSLALLAFFVAGFLSQFGLILFCVGIFPTTFWCTCVLGYSLGEVVRRAEKDAEPTKPQGD